MASEFEETNTAWIEVGHLVVEFLNAHGEPEMARATGKAFAHSVTMLEAIQGVNDHIAATLTDKEPPT